MAARGLLHCLMLALTVLWGLASGHFLGHLDYHLISINIFIQTVLNAKQELSLAQL